eukprot:12235518-Alexandrium_andersonii.AAC.1
MSASLVGSEMCIRDRHALHIWPRPAEAALKPSTGTRRGRQRCLHTVSYTHLTLPTICSV